jgi:glycosyltransferase involved in cell wall biosynthesis
MPTWNRLHFIEDAVSSVLAQTEQRLELLVIDDGSTDGTYERLEAIPDQRLRLLRREHRGISSALNAGLAESVGEWIARLDSDDCWRPEFLEKQLALAASHPAAAAVYSRAEAADASLRPLGVTRGSPPVRPDDCLGSLLLGDFTCNITVLARRRDIVAAGGWLEELPHGEDWDLWLRIARRGSFVWNPEVLALYREHDSNVTRCLWDELPSVRASILQRHLEDPELPEAARALAPVARRRHHVNAAMTRLVLGRAREALAQLGMAWRNGDGLLRVVGYAAAQFFAWFVFPRYRWTRQLHGRALAWRDRRRQRHS